MKSGGLKLKNIAFAFNKNRDYFFKNLTAEFEKGTIHFIRGKNGAGKSTLFRLIQGTLYDDEVVSGVISCGEHDYNFNQRSEASGLAATIKVVVQQFDSMLAPNFTFEKNIRFAQLDRYPFLKPLPVMGTLPQFIERFGISYSTPTYLLSGGQRQILAILMVLQKPTQVLLLDEPTAALDEHNAHMVLEFLRQLHNLLDLTIIIVSHDKELVEQYSPQGYYELADGQLHKTKN